LPRPEEAPVIKITFDILRKKGQAIYITPLRPSTLAAFPPWGSSIGAGCIGLTLAANIQPSFFFTIIFVSIFSLIFNQN
jgi:hypothetical protein